MHVPQARPGTRCGRGCVSMRDPCSSAITDRAQARKGSRFAANRSTGGPVRTEELVRLILAALVVAIVGAARAEPITIAIVPSVPSCSTLIAQEKGYFRDAGLEVKIERIDSMGKAVAFLAANHVQVAQG